VKLLGNILWVVLAGIWLFLFYVIAGIISCIFIITIPFGIQSFKLALFALWPFGRTVVAKPGQGGAGTGCANILWLVLGGWYLVLVHAFTGLLLCLPIITIPFAIQDFKLAGLALSPFGKEIVPIGEAERRRGPRKETCWSCGGTGTARVAMGWPGQGNQPPCSNCEGRGFVWK
jgi:uncharacterized membrane protein YccF (DUF307 family)